MIFEREIGMSDTLLDALWLEGYSIGRSYINASIGNRMAASILDASEAVMNTVLHQPQSACWRRSGAPVGQNLMWITCRHYTLRFV